MSKIIELKIDKKTLPKDGQKIEWQTQEDFDNDVWQQGHFSSGDDVFCIGFEDKVKKWDLSWNIIQWRAL